MKSDVEVGAFATLPHFAGTLAYMSPEQSNSTNLTPASDWYSFGVVLFQLLTGRLPFEGDAAEVFAAKKVVASLK